MLERYVNDAVDFTKALLAVDSPTGFTHEAARYTLGALRDMGYAPVMTNKGGVAVEIGGKDKENAMLLSAHIDTLGGMVCRIKGNGRLQLTPLGGLRPNNCEGENCRIRTRDGKIYDGTFALENPSIHVNVEYNDTKRSFDTCEVTVDEPVKTDGDVKKLGICVGDVVFFDPRTRVTASGYIKSRFLDDKLSAGILLAFAKYIKETGVCPAQNLYLHFTVYEEVGHGASAMPAICKNVREVLAVDMGCVGEGLDCTERQVSICAKDSAGPYSYEMVTKLIESAKKAGADYAVDVYPHYGSDADALLAGGADLRHGLIGPGVFASHGYERSHVDGVKNTLGLLTGLI
ncbi:MAG: M42 family metallopeptidase [Clostridia bacterium]|nr:M42 family metallopeptidase [Clostridia bacterium]MBR0536795.1 M42 family metallopeptidase [Clostridia bacterium]